MRHLVVISNRLPIVINKSNGEFTIREGAGGLVTALKPLLMQRGGAWIGFAGMYDSDRGTGWEETLAQYGGGAIRYYPLTPRRSLYEGYYLQYANQELWPRFHSMTTKMRGAAVDHWDDYARMNRLFAERSCEIAASDDLIWIQDYHLMLLPQLLRERLPSASLGHFLHIPFPPAEIMAQQPHAEEILSGVLAADLLGFHVPAYMDNFIAAAEQIAGARVVSRSETEAVIEHNGHRARLGAFPIGIQPKQLAEPDTDTVRRRLAGLAETLILSMDRLDYTKAIPPRLEAYGQLLEEHPEYQKKVSLVQLIDLSRKSIPAYQEEREKVEAIVEQIEDRHRDWKPLFFEAERWKRKEVAGVMRLSRICLVTPRCDGMNLVAKEYVAAAPDDGVLVLSRQAGAAWQLGKAAVLVDGNSPESIVAGLHTALTMPEDERRSRMARLKENVHGEDVFWWAGRFLENLCQSPSDAERQTIAGPLSALQHKEQLARQLDGREVALLLDYDGTLTPIVRRPEDALLSDEMRRLLEDLAPRCTLAIVSGRDRRDVQKMVGVPSLTYAGSHGYDIEGPNLTMQHEEAQHALPELDQAEAALRERLGGISGARVERKRFAIAIHYREVADEQVPQVEQAVDEVHRGHDGLRKMGGKKIFELQPDVPWDKGRAVLWLAKSLGLDHAGVALIYIGDDVTDEHAFGALRRYDGGIGIRVAAPDEETAARYFLRDCDEVQQFLSWLLETLPAKPC